MSIDMDTKWQIQQGCSLLYKFWDYECAIFDVASGDTHLLDQLSAEALRCLEASPSSPMEIVRQVSHVFELEVDQKLIDHINSLIAKLHNLNLIEPIQ